MLYVYVQEAAGLRDAHARNAALGDEVRTLERLVDELKEQVDDARAAEGLVEQLTDRNLALEDRVRELEECVRDLEALQAMADEVEEQHAAIARQLTTDVDFARAELAEKERRLRMADDELAEYEQTVHKYRALVAALQQQKQGEGEGVGPGDGHAGAGGAAATAEDSQRLASLQLQLQSTSAKAQARAIDAELRMLELGQAREHVALLQAYLPASFARVDGECVALMLLLDRMASKADTLVTHVRAQYNLDADAKVKVAPDQRAFAARLCAVVQDYMYVVAPRWLHWGRARAPQLISCHTARIRAAVRAVQWGVAAGDEAMLVALCGRRGDFGAPEAHLDALLHMLRNEELAPTVSAEPLAKAAALCRHITAAQGLPEPPALALVRAELHHWQAQATVAEALTAQAQAQAGAGAGAGDPVMGGVAGALSTLARAVGRELARLPGDGAALDLDLAASECVRGDELHTAAAAVHAQAAAVRQGLAALQAWAQAVLDDAQGHEAAAASLPAAEAHAQAIWERTCAEIGAAGSLEAAGPAVVAAAQAALDEIGASLAAAGSLARTRLASHPMYRRAEVCYEGRGLDTPFISRAVWATL
jgi:hypothetical protein